MNKKTAKARLERAGRATKRFGRAFGQRLYHGPLSVIPGPRYAILPKDKRIPFFSEPKEEDP